MASEAMSPIVSTKTTHKTSFTIDVNQHQSDDVSIVIRRRNSLENVAEAHIKKKKPSSITVATRPNVSVINTLIKQIKNDEKLKNIVPEEIKVEFACLADNNGLDQLKKLLIGSFENSFASNAKS